MLGELIKPPFLGFEPAALKFLKSLSNPKNNNKLWFDKHRDEYEQYLKQPMRELIDTLGIEINKIDPDIVVNYKSIFRINRDIRFSKNKAPYKSHYAAAFAFGSIKSAEIPQFYFHFNSNEFIFATGQYSMDNDFLKKIRKEIYSDFKNYKSIIKNKKFENTYGEVMGDALTKLPKGYENLNIEKEDPLLVSSIRMKQYYVSKTYEPELILTDKITDVIIDNIKLSYDFTKFLYNATK